MALFLIFGPLNVHRGFRPATPQELDVEAFNAPSTFVTRRRQSAAQKLPTPSLTPKP